MCFPWLSTVKCIGFQVKLEAMDKLASAHESSADVERAEALYLRMLAWREGADQFEVGPVG